MAKKIFIYCILLSVFFSALSPLQVLAQPSPCAEMRKLQEKIKCSIDNMELALNDADKETYLGLVLKGLFSFLAVLFFSFNHLWRYFMDDSGGQRSKN